MTALAEADLVIDDVVLMQAKGAEHNDWDRASYNHSWCSAFKLQSSERCL